MRMFIEGINHMTIVLFANLQVNVRTVDTTPQESVVKPASMVTLVMLFLPTTAQNMVHLTFHLINEGYTIKKGGCSWDIYSI